MKASTFKRTVGQQGMPILVLRSSVSSEVLLELSFTKFVSFTFCAHSANIFFKKIKLIGDTPLIRGLLRLGFAKDEKLLFSLG